MTEKELEQLAIEAKRAYYREWRTKNKDKLRDYNKEWRAKNQEKIREKNRRYWVNKAMSKLAEGSKD